jgi:hypothetical protein
MIWIVGLIVVYVLMAISKHLTGNPIAFLGIAFLGGCVWMLGTMALKVLGMVLA